MKRAPLSPRRFSHPHGGELRVAARERAPPAALRRRLGGVKDDGEDTASLHLADRVHRVVDAPRSYAAHLKERGERRPPRVVCGDDDHHGRVSSVRRGRS